MKRSEMEYQLAIHLAELGLDEADYNARLLLTIIESHGMLPPGSHQTLVLLDGKKVGEQFTCKWEPEDET